MKRFEVHFTVESAEWDNLLSFTDRLRWSLVHNHDTEILAFSARELRPDEPTKVKVVG